MLLVRTSQGYKFIFVLFLLGVSFASFPARMRFALLSSIAQRNHQKKYRAFCLLEEELLT